MPRTRLFRFLLIFFFSAASAFAQSPVDPGKLPGRTLFYLWWHGTPSGEVRKNNSLLALWDDPQLAPVRASFLESFLKDEKKPADKQAVSREELEQYVSLLDNPFLFGYLRQPASRATAKMPTSKDSAAPPAWNGLYFIYDRSGKEQLLSKAVTQMRSSESDIPKISELTVAGIPSLKVERKSGTTYWAEFDKYAVSANELPVFEEVLNVVNGKAGSTSLAQSSAFQEAKPLLMGGVLEFFLAIPPADQIAENSSGTFAAQAKPFLSALKLDAIHSVAGRLSLEGSRSHFSGAVLGDTAPGSLFDVWADGQKNPLSMGYLPPDTISYGETQFNLPGIYNTLRRAFAPSGNSQPNMAGALEQMAQTRLGMPLPDALGLVTGEVAWIETSPTLDEAQKVYLLGIRDKPNALKLTRTLMGDQITSERNEGSATYMKISLHGGRTSAGLAQWNFYYLAMTPTLLFGSSKSDTLHKYAGQDPASPDPALKGLLAARAQFPEKLNGFSYLDFQKLDWPGMQAKWVAAANKAAQTAKSTEDANHQKKMADWLQQVDPAVLSRHLHTMSGASWKDAKGVHFEEWLD